MTRPRGIAPINVTKNSLSVCKKPMFREWMTTGICSSINSIESPCFLYLVGWGKPPKTESGIIRSLFGMREREGAYCAIRAAWTP